MDSWSLHEAERLRALRSLNILGTAPEEHFDAVCRTAQALFGVPIALVSLVDEHHQWFKARCGLDLDGTPREAAFCRYTLLSRDVFVVEDTTRDARVSASPLVTGRHAIRFYAGAPLVLDSGLCVGSVCVMDTAPRPFSSGERRQLQDLARIVVAHLRLHEVTLASVAAHDALQAMTERLNLAQDAAGAGLFDWYVGDDHAHLSPEALRHLGLPENRSPDAALEEWAAAIHPDDLPRVLGEARRAAATGSAYRVEFRVRSTEGGERWVLGLGRVAADEHGRPLRIAGISLDCTERRRAEEARIASEAALRASEERLALALDSGSDGLWDYDIATDTAWVSDRWSMMLGYAPGEIRVDRHTWVRLLHPKDKSQALRQMDDHLRGRTAAFECECRLRCRDGGWKWVLARGKVVSRSPNGAPRRMVGTHIDIGARKAAESRITWMARHDGLTELPNRLQFRERLDQRLAELERRNADCAVLCLDLDRFKAVNDTLGHLAGDALLREISHRIRMALRGEDMVARFGGDEFAVLLVKAGHPDKIARAAQRLIKVVQVPVVLGAQRVEVGVSIGIAIAPVHSRDAETLFKQADLALYRAKAEGRNTFRFFEPGMDDEIETRRRLELDLRLALQRGEFELHYQPILDIATGEIRTVEALVRWRHPTRGLMAPGAFIPLAEETGLIVPLGEWVLRTAAREARLWPSHVRVAANVSAVQVRSGTLIQTVRAALSASGLAPGRLEVEITESVLMTDIEAVCEVLHDLRRLGVGVALDDFGTGYSSLNYLRQFPFDKLKIDRSFITASRSPEGTAIVRAIVALGRGLSMSVTAEGIETPEQLELARVEGCTEAQGYFIGRPCASEDGLVARIGRRTGSPQRRHGSPRAS